MPHTTRWLIIGLASLVLAHPRGAGGQPVSSTEIIEDAMKDWPRPEHVPGRTDAQIATAIADYAKALYDGKYFSGAVLAARAGKVVMSRAYGLANIATQAPNTLDTRFNIASINKSFTKIAVAQLAEAGKLSLDDTLRSHLPDLPVPGADRITIRQLVEHRAGMGNLLGLRYRAASASSLRELDDYIPLLAYMPLLFEPGTSQQYSNSGYVVLGLIIEHVTGEKYRDYVTRHVLAPSGMASTSFPMPGDDAPGRAIGYMTVGDDGQPTMYARAARRVPGRLVPNTDVVKSHPSSAGGAYTTAGDLLRLWNTLIAGKLLSPRWTNWMLNRSFEDTGRSPSTLWGGGGPGVNATIETSGEWTVIALANLDPPSATAVTHGALDIIRGPRAAPPGMMIRRRPPSGPASTELAGEVGVPAAMSGHRLTVEARVNGKGPFRFAIDTGSSAMLRISDAVQRTLQLDQVGEVMVGDPSGRGTTRRPVVRAGSVEIGGARFRDVDATVGSLLPGDRLDGVIGLGLFANLTATLDYRAHQLRIGRQPLSLGDGHVIELDMQREAPAIDIEVAGITMNVDIDTGSPAGLTLPASWTAKLSFAGEPKVAGKRRTVSNELDVRRAALRGQLRVAGFTQSSPSIEIVDQLPVASLGSQFLQQYTVTFDMVNQRMALAR